MARKASIRIADHFTELTDPRRRQPTYPLLNIVTMALCAVICGCDDFVSIADWARMKKDWLAKFLDMRAGVPSHDRFNAIFAGIKPAEFEKCLLSWIASLQEVTGGQLIAIDGKTLRGSYDRASSKSAIHMVSAWASANHISLGQVVVDEKSNEITAIPKLLELLEISGSLVTIDAMGCQSEIAEKIIAGGGDYVLAVKGNQPALLSGIESFFMDHLTDEFARVKTSQYETHEQGHGRVERRSYFVCDLPQELPDANRWKGLKRIGLTINETLRGEKPTLEVRYYIMSRKLTARQFAKAARGHWSIENSLHWQLDVTFGEDKSRVRQGHADTNCSLLRRTALSLLKREQTAKVGVKNRRLRAGWNDEYLEKVLFGTQL